MAKESSKRGYMNKEEIEEHLKKLKTNEGRIGYLTKVIAYNKTKGEKLLAPQTIQYAREIRDELYKKRDKYLGRSTDLYANWDNLANSDVPDRPLRERIVLPGELKKGKRKKGKDLGDKLMYIITIVGLGAGLFFLSFNITGNLIADLTTKTSSFLGVGLLIVGLIAGFFWIKKRKIN